MDGNDFSYTPEKLEFNAQQLMHSDPTIQLKAATYFRRILSIERSPPIGEVVAANVTDRLIELMQSEDTPRLQLECAWALTNIVSGSTEYTRHVVEKGLLAVLVRYVQSVSVELAEQCIWALGNIVGDGADMRDLATEEGALVALCSAIDHWIQQPNGHLSILRNCAWTMSNFFRGKPCPNVELISFALPLVVSLLASPDIDVVVDVCWCCAYASDGPNSNIECVVQAGIVPIVIDLLGRHDSNQQIAVPCVRTIGNVVSGDEAQTQCVLDHPAVLASLSNILNNDSKQPLKKEALFALSNMLAGTESQVGACVQVGILQDIIKLMQMSIPANTAKEAVWCIMNAYSSPCPLAHTVLAGMRAMSIVLKLLDKVIKDNRTTEMALGAWSGNLETARSASGKQTNPFATMMLELQEPNNIALLVEITRESEEHNDFVARLMPGDENVAQALASASLDDDGEWVDEDESDQEEQLDQVDDENVLADSEEDMEER